MVPHALQRTAAAPSTSPNELTGDKSSSFQNPHPPTQFKRINACDCFFLRITAIPRSLFPGRSTASVRLGRSMRSERRCGGFWSCFSLKCAQNVPFCAKKAGFCYGFSTCHGSRFHFDIFRQTIHSKQFISFSQPADLVKKLAFQGEGGWGSSFPSSFFRAVKDNYAQMEGNSMQPPGANPEYLWLESGPLKSTRQ